jgi:hypothetical protein
MLTQVDAYVFEVKRLVEKDPKLNNVITNVFLRHHSINKALVMKTNLIEGNVVNIHSPFLMEIAKEIGVNNYKQYFNDEGEIKIVEILDMCNSLKNDNLLLKNENEKLEKKGVV